MLVGAAGSPVPGCATVRARSNPTTYPLATDYIPGHDSMTWEGLFLAGTIGAPFYYPCWGLSALKAETYRKMDKREAEKLGFECVADYYHANIRGQGRTQYYESMALEEAIRAQKKEERRKSWEATQKLLREKGFKKQWEMEEAKDLGFDNAKDYYRFTEFMQDAGYVNREWAAKRWRQIQQRESKEKEN